MFKTFTGSLVSSILLATASNADAPNVVADIPSVHSLISIVMDGVGKPDLIIPTTASPHDFSFRPSQAKVMQNADIVFWVGEDLTPWLSDPIETLAKDAKKVELLEDSRTHVLEFEEEEKGEEEHDDHEHEHGHGEHDPHAWLDPINASIWLDIIAEQLSVLDADHSDTYQKNAANGKLKLEELTSETTEALNEYKGWSFIVAHDAYMYFATRFGLDIVGAIASTDDEAPSAGRVAKIAKQVESQNVQCIFKDIHSKDGLVNAVTGQTNVKSILLDPMGAGIEIGTTFYGELIRGFAKSIQTCVSDKT